VNIFRVFRIGFLLSHLLAWNAILGLGLWLDGMKNGPAFTVACAVAGLGTSLVFGFILFTRVGRVFAVRPTCDIKVTQKELWFTFLLTLGLGLVSLYAVST
jgi:hypothetical protein